MSRLAAYVVLALAAGSLCGYVSFQYITGTQHFIEGTVDLPAGLALAPLTSLDVLYVLCSWVPLLAAALLVLAARALPRAVGWGGFVQVTAGTRQLALRASGTCRQYPCHAHADAGPPPTQMRGLRMPLQIKRLLAWQLPPRAFFARWCGGLSVAEAVGVLAWLGLNALWLASGLPTVLAGDGFATSWQDKLDG